MMAARNSKTIFLVGSQTNNERVGAEGLLCKGLSMNVIRLNNIVKESELQVESESSNTSHEQADRGSCLSSLCFRKQMIYLEK